MRACAVCSTPITAATSEPFRFGSVHGSACVACAKSMESGITTWMRGRMVEVERDREQRAEAQRKAEADARAEQEREAAAILAKEIAHSRLAQLSAEGWPLATRSEMARARRRNAA